MSHSRTGPAWAHIPVPSPEVYSCNVPCPEPSGPLAAAAWRFCNTPSPVSARRLLCVPRPCSPVPPLPEGKGRCGDHPHPGPQPWAPCGVLVAVLALAPGSLLALQTSALAGAGGPRPRALWVNSCLAGCAGEAWGAVGARGSSFRRELGADGAFPLLLAVPRTSGDFLEGTCPALCARLRPAYGTWQRAAGISGWS